MAAGGAWVGCGRRGSLQAVECVIRVSRDRLLAAFAWCEGCCRRLVPLMYIRFVERFAPAFILEYRGWTGS